MLRVGGAHPETTFCSTTDDLSLKTPMSFSDLRPTSALSRTTPHQSLQATSGWLPFSRSSCFRQIRPDVFTMEGITSAGDLI